MTRYSVTVVEVSETGFFWCGPMDTIAIAMGAINAMKDPLVLRQTGANIACHPLHEYAQLLWIKLHLREAALATAAASQLFGQCRRRRGEIEPELVRRNTHHGAVVGADDRHGSGNLLHLRG